MEEGCNECLVAGAVATVSEICKEHNLDCNEFDELLKKNATPEEWVSKLVDIHKKAEGRAKDKIAVVLTELCHRLNSNACTLFKGGL